MPDESAQKIDANAERSRIFGEVSDLLAFLGKNADSLLQSQFDDMRHELAAPARKLALPPCKSYKEFLERLASIGPRLSAPDTGGGAAPDSKVGPSEDAFLLFSRDFLAAVAAPATVESIRFTQAYVQERRHASWRRLAHGLCPYRGGPPAETPKKRFDAGAGRLASRVAWTEFAAFYLTVFTLVVSAYAFSGQRILDSRKQIVADYDRVEGDLASYFREHAQPVNFNPLRAPAHCNPTFEPSPVQLAAAASAKARQVAVLTGAADVSPVLAGPTDGEPFDAKQCALYWQLKSANENMAAVTLHLVSWTQVPLSLPGVNRIFGVVQGVVQDTALVHADICHLLDLYGVSAEPCPAAFLDLMYRTQEVAESLLGCIALYVLPTLYGCLGAAAAALRALRRKVDLSLVTMTDRGRLRQDLILGALCGAIMGLFVGYLGKGTSATGLGLSALALLAGYNVSGTFAFLDELYKRVFQPAKSASPD